MKKLFLFAVLAMILAGCGGSGESRVVAVSQASEELQSGSPDEVADTAAAVLLSLAEAKDDAERRSEAIGNELNECYYVVGSIGTLKELGILESGFDGKSKIAEAGFDRSRFTKADKRTLREIATGSRKVKILTKQPVGSYTIADDGGGKKIVRIENPTLFWEKTEFLVIEAK